MATDSLDQHRRELDATLAALQAVRDHAYAEHATIVRQEAELLALRSDLSALANRVEALTRAVGIDNGDHARRADWLEAGIVSVVVNMEAERPELVGVYLGTVEDTVEYLAADGLIRRAPYDCVRIVQRRELAELLAEAGSS
jgi:hypothetical protein